MPPALDRLLASPSALRLLRAIVNSPELPALCRHRHYSTDENRPAKQQWRRWNRAAQDAVNRDKVRQLLESDDHVMIPQDEPNTTKTVPPADDLVEDEAAQWARNLARRERLNGKAGILTGWTSRASLNYHLPTEDTPDAEFLWGTFIKHRALVPQVIDHAVELMNKTGKTYPRLYELVMVCWLRRHPMVALEYHRLMSGKLKIQPLPLKLLAQTCRSAARTDAYAALMVLYRSSDEGGLYDEIVPPLIEMGDITMARSWHDLCIHHQDLPSEVVASNPVVQILSSEDANFGIASHSGASKKAQQEARKYNRELLRRLSGRELAPVRFEDSFCARMFATKTFPPDSIIKGLAMVGVNEIGPQAVLAMASRTDPIEELPRIFEELRTNGITLQGCVFSLALEKFAMQHQWRLVHSMLNSDQHPDVFGDTKVQQRLLKYYIVQNDHQQIQRTLAVLTLFHNDSSQESWNLLLQTYIGLSGPQHVQEMVEDMRARLIMITPESITAIKGLLRQRQIGRRPSRRQPHSYDDLRFVTRAFMTILEAGIGAVSPLYWREIVRRFGMSGRFRELRRLLLWLLCWYAPRGGVQFLNLPESPFLKPATQRLRSAYPGRSQYFHFPSMVDQHANERHPVRQLFPPSVQQALIIWGFKAGLLPNATLEQSMYGPTLAKKHYRRKLSQAQLLRHQHWSAGLQTIVQLRNLGVYIHRHTVVKALQAQFVVMFGRGRSRKKENRIMEQVNTLSYSAYVREVNRIWGSPLFKEPQIFAQGIVHNHMWHPRMRRQINRRRSVSLTEILGSGWHNHAKETDHAADETQPADPELERLEKLFTAQSKAMNPGSGYIDDIMLEHAAGFTRRKRRQK